MNRKVFLRGIAIGLVVATAIAMAFVYRRASAAQRWVAAVEQSRALAEHTDEAYRAGADQQSADALRQYLEYLEASSPMTHPWEPPAHPLLDAHGLGFERTIIAVRLAVVEERRGNRQSAEDFWTRAEQHAASGKLRVTDRAALREMVLEIDQNAAPRNRPPG